MRKLALLLATFSIACGVVDHQSGKGTKSKNAQPGDRGDTERRPRLGYPDLYIPPTKGNGF